LQQQQKKQSTPWRFLHTFEHGFKLNGTAGAVDGARRLVRTHHQLHAKVTWLMHCYGKRGKFDDYLLE